MLARTILTVAVIIWGFTFVATKICLEYLSPTELLTARFVIALPLLALMVLLRGDRVRIARSDLAALLTGSTLFVIHFLIQNWGLVFTSATHTAWLVSVTPLAMAVLAFLLLRERIGVRTAVGIGIATLGVLLLVSNGNLADVGWIRSTGDWLALASAFTWALYTIATRNLSRRYPPLFLFTVILAPVTIGMLIYTTTTSQLAAYLHLPSRPLLALLYLAVAGIALGNWFWLEGVRRVGAARAGVFLYLEPLWTTALAIPYLGEQLGFFSAVGAALVLAGVIEAAVNGARRDPENIPTDSTG
jgi:drug/metabolite transporter (DMT)-like permease